MKQKCITLYLLLAALAACTGAGAQTLMNRDAAITSAVADISTANQKKLIEDLVAFHNRNNLSSRTDPDRGIGAAAEYLYLKARSYAPASDGRLSIEKIHYTAGGAGTRLGREVTLCNIVATIKGGHATDNRVIAVLAHYDSRNGDGNDSLAYAPGANDDGSGIACLMEMTRIMSKFDLPVTVKLIFLSGEEHGLFGAAHMAALARRENWNLIAVINNDMIANSNASETNTQTNTVVRVFSENIPAVENDDARRIRIYNSAENDSPSRQLARYIKETGERYVDNMTVKLVYRNDRFGRGGDHTPFSRQGFAAVRMCEVNENYDRTHQYVREENGRRYGDETWAVDFEYLRKNTGINLAAILNMALAPAAPENVRLITAGLTNHVDLSWDAPAGGKTPHAYYVLIRETDCSQWQTKILVRDTQASLPFSKDNYFFAVQSVDEDGHESPAAFAYGSNR
ncbi:MAG: M28 family metallopeptidase [Tannerella sp.]|nr:M28 family metallopeptidase [Tannerella sp.]